MTWCTDGQNTPAHLQRTKSVLRLRMLRTARNVVLGLRHAIGCLVLAAVAVGGEHLAVSGTVPLMARLHVAGRISLYDQITTISAGLLGFLIAAVAILVSFDLRRRIVK